MDESEGAAEPRILINDIRGEAGKVEDGFREQREAYEQKEQDDFSQGRFS